MQHLSGGSRANRIATVATLAIIALSSLTGFRATSAATQIIPLKLGFGPSSLTTVSNGVPVYTSGDTIWASSDYNQTVSVTLLSPSSQTVLRRTLDPRAIIPLYSFSTVSPNGLWMLQISAAGGTVSIPVNFVSAGAHQAVIGSVEYSLSGDNLSTAAHAGTSDAYDMEVCAFSNGSHSAVGFQLPEFAGSGTVDLHISGNVLSMTTNGSVSSPFAFWFELYYPYSFDVMGTNTSILRTLRVAASQPILIDSAGSKNGTLEWSVAPRHGRFQAMAFFQSAGDVYVSQARLLMADDGSWIPLDSCGVQSIQSQNFAYQTNLAGDPNSWPRRIYFMYRAFGVELVSSAALKANVSRVSFVSPPWPDGLQNATVNVTPNQDIQQISQWNGSLYLLVRHYPVSVNYSLSMEGIEVASGALLVNAPYTSLERQVNLAKLSARVLSDENTTVGLRVVLNGGTVTRQLNANENATFFLPAGTATVTGSQGSNSQDVRVTLTNNLESTVVFNFTTGRPLSLGSTVLFNLTAGRLLELVLAATGIIGTVANLVWLRRSRSWLRRVPFWR